MATFHDAVRMLAHRVPGIAAAYGTAPTLERLEAGQEAPRVIDAQVVENATTSRVIPGAPTATFEAFLDGVQETRVVTTRRGIPIVWGRVAAVVRQRRNRRLTTWEKPLVDCRLYAPLSVLASTTRAELAGAPMVDTSRSDDDTLLARHPTHVVELALHAVQDARERVERELAEQWCRRVSTPLMVDGSITSSEIAARNACVVGIIKSHRNLYATSSLLDIILTLSAGERTPVLRITPRHRTPVHSWYLRLRDGVAHDALWGIVRVEVAESSDPTARADEVSRWVLAERTPLALPDARWDRMAYPVRECEEVLRAIG
ncbi:MAG: hypothetical protein ACT4PJ_07120 [Gemmatimonadaceae bacterium]